MALVESIQQAIEYMEKNLTEDITIGDIARHANVSSFHFQRTFGLLTDTSVAEYLRRRRLTLAAQELLTTDNRIIDIAYKYGYDTPEAFTKAFRRQHGTSPTEVRKHEGKLQTYNRLVIQVTLEGAEPMKYSVVNKEAFTVAGKKRRFSCANDEQSREIPKFWQDVNAEGFTDKLFTLNNGAIKGVLGVCEGTTEEMKSDQVMDYWVATSVEGEIPEELEKMEIPASKWVVFEVHGPMPYAMQDTWKRIFSEWFPSNSYEHSGAPDFELYTDEDPSNPDLYSEIWIPIK